LFRKSQLFLLQQITAFIPMRPVAGGTGGTGGGLHITEKMFSPGPNNSPLTVIKKTNQMNFPDGNTNRL
jgi:hypothetical protein